jgi:hypothetical protein
MGIDLPDKNAFDDRQARVAGVRGNTGVRNQSQSRFRDAGLQLSSVPADMANPRRLLVGKGHKRALIRRRHRQ